MTALANTLSRLTQRGLPELAGVRERLAELDRQLAAAEARLRENSRQWREAPAASKPALAEKGRDLRAKREALADQRGRWLEILVALRAEKEAGEGLAKLRMAETDEATLHAEARNNAAEIDAWKRKADAAERMLRQAEATVGAPMAPHSAPAEEAALRTVRVAQLREIHGELVRGWRGVWTRGEHLAQAIILKAETEKARETATRIHSRLAARTEEE